LTWFLLRRLAALVLLGIGITFVVFMLTQLVAGNAAVTNLGEQGSAGRFSMPWDPKTDSAVAPTLEPA
jgi:ABC-type dipeptide/oligopeptide/nickel transport system permease component